MSIHPATLMGPVALTVADLDNQIKFYERMLGLRVLWRKDGAAGLGAEGGADLLRLVYEPTARKRYRNVTGLYHFAVLYPSRVTFARAVARLFALRYQNAPTDHVLTKSTYLDDPEGNGIELYAESPEDGTWTMANGNFTARHADGRPSDGREALDVEALFALLDADEPVDGPLAPTTRIGHVHLHVRNVAEAVDFYHGVLDFDVMGMAKAVRMAFVSAGGYHHHIGLNTWQGEGVPPPPGDAVGLRYFTILLPNADAQAVTAERVKQAGGTVEPVADGLLVRDPSHNAAVLSVAS